MPRAANPFYYGQDQQLGAALGQTLGRALFGDPEAAAKLALQKAQMDNYAANAEESRAHAGLYGKQGEGVDIQNNASRSLPELIASMVPPQAPVAAPADPLAPAPAAGGFDQAAFQAGLPAAIAAMAQMKGDQVNMGDTLGALSAFLGNDEFARRGLIAQGHTPGKDFALTPDRADAISARDASEDEHRAVATANISAETQRRGQDIRSTDTRRGQDLTSTDRRRGQDIASDDRTYATDNKNYDRAGAVSLGNTLGKVTSTVRTAQHNKEVGGVPDSYHLDTRGGRGIDIARKPGVTHAQVVQSYRNAGYTILEQLDEGDHSHLALSGGPNAGKSGGGSKGSAKRNDISEADAKLVDGELKKQMEERGINGASSTAKLRANAYARFQETGNPAQAVGTAIDAAVNLTKRERGQKPAAKPAGKPAPKQEGGDERSKALAAIKAGADPAAIRKLYKQRTGQNL